MTSWQRRARFVIAGGAAVFAVVVFVALKHRAPLSPPTLAIPADPGAVVEVTGGRVERFKLSRQDVRVDYRRQLTYANGSTKLEGVTIAADARAGGRSFTVTGKEASVGQNESTLELNGDVRLSASDGLTADRARQLFGQGRDGARGRPGGVLARPDDRLGRRHDVRHRT
jgi:hypothetical protein